MVMVQDAGSRRATTHLTRFAKQAPPATGNVSIVVDSTIFVDDLNDAMIKCQTRHCYKTDFKKSLEAPRSPKPLRPKQGFQTQNLSKLPPTKPSVRATLSTASSIVAVSGFISCHKRLSSYFLRL